MQPIFQLDRQFFYLINGRLHHPWLDQLMPFLRNPQFWVPVYLFLLVMALVNFGKNKWWWILFAACTGIITNYVSSDLIKQNIFRLRPCNDPEMADSVRFLLNYKPISSSFTSSHATNHFGIAAFLYYSLKDIFGKWPRIFFLWAFLIGYAQVYVGVHYPGDIIAGALIGILLGYLWAKVFNKYIGLG